MSFSTSTAFRASSYTDPKLEMKAKKTIQRTYMMLTAMTAFSALGIYLQMQLHLNFRVFSFLGILCLLGYGVQKFMGSSQKSKIMTLLTFALFQGISIGPLVELVNVIDPSVLYLATFGTLAIFVCFSVASFIGKDNFLFIGGTLGSLLSVMCLLSFLNIFFRLEWIVVLQLYGGLVVFLFYILYDTQKMIALANSGNENYCDFAVELFLDLIAVFVRLLIIILKNKGKRKKKKDEDDD